MSIITDKSNYICYDENKEFYEKTDASCVMR